MLKLSNEVKSFVKTCALNVAQGAMEGIAGTAIGVITAAVCESIGVNRTLATLVGGFTGVATILTSAWVDYEIEKDIRANEDDFWRDVNKLKKEYDMD